MLTFFLLALLPTIALAVICALGTRPTRTQLRRQLIEDFARTGPFRVPTPSNVVALDSYRHTQSRVQTSRSRPA